LISIHDILAHLCIIGRRGGEFFQIKMFNMNTKKTRYTTLNFIHTTYNLYIMFQVQLVCMSLYFSAVPAGSLTGWLIWPHNGMVLENRQFEFNKRNIWTLPFSSELIPGSRDVIENSI